MRIEFHAYTDGGVELVRHITTNIPDDLLATTDLQQDSWALRVQHEAGAVLTRAQQAMKKLEAAQVNVDTTGIQPATIDNADEDEPGHGYWEAGDPA